MTLDEVYRKIERVAESLGLRKIANVTQQNLPSVIVLEENELTLVSKVYDVIMRAHENGDTLVRQKPEVKVPNDEGLDFLHGRGKPMDYKSAFQSDIAEVVYRIVQEGSQGKRKPIPFTSTKETPKGPVITDNTPNEANCPFLVYLVIPKEEAAPSQRRVLRELREKGIPYWMFSDRAY